MNDIWYADRLGLENNGKEYTEIAYFHGVEDWEWSDIVVIRDPHGSYWIGEDSGCSCYSAFEYYSSLEDFTGPLTLEQAKESVEISIHDDSYIKEFYDVSEGLAMFDDSTLGVNYHQATIIAMVEGALLGEVEIAWILSNALIGQSVLEL